MPALSSVQTCFPHLGNLVHISFCSSPSALRSHQFPFKTQLRTTPKSTIPSASPSPHGRIHQQWTVSSPKTAKPPSKQWKTHLRTTNTSATAFSSGRTHLPPPPKKDSLRDCLCISGVQDVCRSFLILISLAHLHACSR